jgi:hypothetical protein
MGYAVGAHASARCGSPLADRPPTYYNARRHYAHRRLARLGLVQLMVPTRGGPGRASLRSGRAFHEHLPIPAEAAPPG